MRKESILSIIHPVALSFVSLGPIGWFLIDYYSHRYDRLVFLFVSSLLLSILSTLLWVLYVKLRKK